MTSITNIDLNLSQVNCAVVVYAKQNDKLARHIAATLYDGATAWTPPAGSYPIIRFLKPDGTSGFYDVDENNNAATTISGHVATMTIVEQALTVYSAVRDNGGCEQLKGFYASIGPGVADEFRREYANLLRLIE